MRTGSDAIQIHLHLQDHFHSFSVIAFEGGSFSGEARKTGEMEGRTDDGQPEYHWEGVNGKASKVPVMCGGPVFAGI